MKVYFTTTSPLFFLFTFILFQVCLLDNIFAETITLPLPADKDASISSAIPDHNGGSAGLIEIGMIQGHEFRSLIHFNGIPSDATITSAYLTIWRESGSGAFDMRVNLQSNSWNESTVTWNNHGTYRSSPQASIYQQ